MGITARSPPRGGGEEQKGFKTIDLAHEIKSIEKSTTKSNVVVPDTFNVPFMVEFLLFNKVPPEFKWKIHNDII